MTKRMIRLSVLLAIAALGAAVPVACSDDSEGDTAATGTTTGSTAPNGSGTSTGGATAAGGAGTGTATGGTTGTAGAGTSAGGGVIVEAPCQGHIYQCGDTLDNDMDGLIDSQDPDCLGPCDNTEDSYYGGISGQPGPDCTVDCYFDQDSGAGNDDCYWNHKCDPGEVDPNYYPEPWVGDKCAYDPNANTPGTSQSCDQLYNAQSQTCMDYCGPLTPNGCDCFGCCELPAGGGNYIWLGSEGVDPSNMTVCTQAEASNPDICHPCLPVQACLNECETCELCIGKTTLPPECFDPDGGSTSSSSGAGGSGGGTTVPGQCPPGVQACGLPGQDPCPSGFYCITGCCYGVPN